MFHQKLFKFANDGQNFLATCGRIVHFPFACLKAQSQFHRQHRTSGVRVIAEKTRAASRKNIKSTTRNVTRKRSRKFWLPEKHLPERIAQSWSLKSFKRLRQNPVMSQ